MLHCNLQNFSPHKEAVGALTCVSHKKLDPWVSNNQRKGHRLWESAAATRWPCKERVVSTHCASVTVESYVRMFHGNIRLVLGSLWRASLLWQQMNRITRFYWEMVDEHTYRYQRIIHLIIIMVRNQEQPCVIMLTLLFWSNHFLQTRVKMFAYKSLEPQ